LGPTARARKRRNTKNILHCPNRVQRTHTAAETSVDPLTVPNPSLPRKTCPVVGASAKRRLPSKTSPSQSGRAEHGKQSGAPCGTPRVSLEDGNAGKEAEELGRARTFVSSEYCSKEPEVGACRELYTRGGRGSRWSSNRMPARLTPSPQHGRPSPSCRRRPPWPRNPSPLTMFVC
jgi:hypothetical protein